MESRSFFVYFSGVLSAILTLSGPSAMATQIRPMTDRHGMRVLPPSVLQSRRFQRRQSGQSKGFVIRDLGLPAVICPPLTLVNVRSPLVRCTGGGSSPPGTFQPAPTAIDRYGNVAIAMCPPAGCVPYRASDASYNAYVYDYSDRALIPLATFALPTGGRPSPLPQAGNAAIDEFHPNAMNDRGQIVGSLTRITGATTTVRPIIWTRQDPLHSTIAYLDSTPNEQGTAYGINNLGVSVGSNYVFASNPANYYDVAVRYSGLRAFRLAPKDEGNYSDAFGINDAGVVAGEEEGFAGTFYGNAFSAIPTQYQCPPPFDLCDQNSALAINGANDVLGNYVSNYFDMASQMFVGFLDNHAAVFATLAPSCFFGSCPPQFDATTNEYVLALNNLDDFIGYFDGRPWVSFSPSGDANGLLPPDSGWTIVTATAMNDRRQIVGQGYHTGFGQTLRAYLLEPKP